MMLIVENLSKSYGDKVLFDNVVCTISNQERIGLIGLNGTGKSTFLKVIAGIDNPDSGEIKHPKDYRIEYLAQEPELDPNYTVIEHIFTGQSPMMKVLRQYEEALQSLEADPRNELAQEHLFNMQQKMDELDAWEASTKAKTILTKLGITEFNRSVTELSGGQKKRVALASALIQPADLLILDEPTNHLDHSAIEWLEVYLNTYPGSILLVTHDRYFLNRVTNRIYELDRGRLFVYEGNYETFLEKKAEREELERQSEQKHKNLLRRELAWLRRGARARTTKQKARIDRITEWQEKTFHTNESRLDMAIGSTRLGKKVIELKDIHLQLNGQKIIAGFDWLIKPSDRIGIIGPNGIGKSTLLNIMAKRIRPDHGEVIIGDTVKIGYYTQGDEEIDDHLRVIDYIKDTAEIIYTKEGHPITAEQMLEHFLFSRRDQYTYIHRLSGGEKRRLYLLKILMTEPNVLLLDEPTNDLDTQTLSVLEEYLQEFPGVVMTVSHDRYFLDRVVDQLFIFKGQGHIETFYGNYSEYLESQKRQLEQEQESIKVKPERPKKQPKRKLTYQEQKEWETIEDEIFALEEQLQLITEQIETAGSDFEQVQQLFSEQQKLETKLEQKMQRWEELSILIEEIESSS